MNKQFLNCEIYKPRILKKRVKVLSSFLSTDDCSRLVQEGPKGFDKVKEGLKRLRFKKFLDIQDGSRSFNRFGSCWV